MPIRFKGPVRPRKLISPDPINIPVVRDNKASRVRQDVEYFKANGEMPSVEPLLGPPEGQAIGDADVSAGGDNKAFIDYRTGLEWVRLAQTNTFTDTTIQNELQEGGQFAGFRIANEAETESLLHTITPNYFDPVHVYAVDTHYIVPAQWRNWNSIMGITGNKHGRDWSYGIYDTGSGFKHGGTDAWAESNRLPNRLMKFNKSEALDFDYMGIFLVSDGGNTLLSQEFPHYMVNNPNSPYNQGT